MGLINIVPPADDIPNKSGCTANPLQSGAMGSQNDCNSTTYNALTYYTSNGPSTSIGASTTDGALYSQAYNDTWVAQVAQDYRNGNLFVRGKNNGSWTSWNRIAKVSEIPTNPYQVLAGLEYVTKINNLSSTTGYSLSPGYVYVLYLSTVGLSGYQCKLYLAHTLYYSSDSSYQGSLSLLFSNTKGDGAKNYLDLSGNVLTEVNKGWSSYLTIYRLADGYHAW